ncbi:MAG: hypothetical protein NC411_02740 [Bacteroides sp.]|nr:hypothetical protein [Bacteroides sp.]
MPKEVINPQMPECTALDSGVGSGVAMLPTGGETVIDKKPITSSLRVLSIGESAIFPIEQRTSALVVANRLKKELARTGWDYSYCDDEDNFIVKITRTA